MSNAIGTVADNFFTALDQAGNELKSFSQELNQKDIAIQSALDNFDKLKITQTVSKKGFSPVDQALKDTLEDMEKDISAWKEKVVGYHKSQQFMHDHEKYLVVMVFGAVKSGKSTLGNFIAGREWLRVPYDNAYKHRPPTRFATQEKGRDTGDIEKDETGHTWFSEGVTDTTGDIQYFTLSGLRWFDSPGTGAIAKKDDKRNMEEMVKEYLKYVDLCVFLINSSEPGLMEDMKYMELLSREEQEALIVITKSDMMDEDTDDQGEIVGKVVAKPAEDRSKQEEDLCKRLKQEYPQLDINKFHAMSISTWLAKEAMCADNEKEFQESHLDLFMEKLANKAQSNVIGLKMARPKKAMNHFLQELITGDEKVLGIKGLREKLQLILDFINEYRESIDKRRERMTSTISHHTWEAVQREIGQMAHETERTGKSVETAAITQTVFRIAQPIVADTINHELSKIIGKNKSITEDLAVEIDAPSLQKTSLSQKTEQMGHHYTVYDMVPRDPDGVIEHIRSFFGKTYYRKVSYRETRYSTVVVGSNIEEVLDQLKPQIDHYIEHTVQANLERIENEYFAQQENAVHIIYAKLDELEKQLKKLQYQ